MESATKASVDVADGELTAKMLDVLLNVSVTTADRYYPAIMSVLWNDTAAEDAIALVEAA